MRIFILTLIALLNTFFVHAQSADEIIQDVISKTKEYSAVELQFDYTMLNTDMDINESNKGSLIFQGNQYALKLSELGMQILCDGEDTYTYNVDANELTINTLGDEDQMMNPTSLLTMYEKGFSSKYIGSKVIDGKNCYQIELTPDGTDLEFDKVFIFIDKDLLFLKRALMYVGNGTTYTLNVNDLKPNIEVTPKQFVFDTDAHPGVDVLDLR